MVTNYVNTSYSIIQPHESFGIVESDTINFDNEQFIGEIEVKENGLSIDCDYWSIIEKIKKEARQSGGNLIRIDEHKKPSTFGSNCHQIKASIFRVENPRPYEKLINWSPERKLTIEDFKASTTDRPFQASTYSRIVYYIKSNSLKGVYQINVRTQFDCFKSYFKPSAADSSVLAHEQLHFDIAEIYARKFFKQLLEKDLNKHDVSNQADKLLYEINTELSKKQDEYDFEVYENPDLQSKWNSWVSSQLKKYAAYEQKEINLTDGS